MHSIANSNKLRVTSVLKNITEFLFSSIGSSLSVKKLLIHLLQMRNEETLKRELNSLNSINDHYPKYILTMDMDPEIDFDGIRKMNVLDWLLNI